MIMLYSKTVVNKFKGPFCQNFVVSVPVATHPLSPKKYSLLKGKKYVISNLKYVYEYNRRKIVHEDSIRLISVSNYLLSAHFVGSVSSDQFQDKSTCPNQSSKDHPPTPPTTLSALHHSPSWAHTASIQL